VASVAGLASAEAGTCFFTALLLACWFVKDGDQAINAICCKTSERQAALMLHRTSSYCCVSDRIEQRLLAA
jgi:hypothetical protein